MSDKPLHVQTGEALGWYDCSERSDSVWVGFKNGVNLDAPVTIPRFDTSVCACAPLIERFTIELAADGRNCWFAALNQDIVERSPRLSGIGGTPWLAICALLIALHKDGKIAESESYPERIKTRL